jgi:hypothetical protein
MLVISMQLSKLLSTCVLVLGISLPLAACDDGDEGETADTNAEGTDTNNETTGNDTESEGGMDIECSVFCTGFVDMCIQTGNSTEFQTNDECLAACMAWDQAGVNCRYEQIIGGACDQAGNMGSAC